MRSVDDILSFCVRAWSEKRDIRIKKGSTFYSDPDEPVVIIPDFFGSNYPDLLGLPRWRFWRFYAFHLSMQQLLSPAYRDTILDELVGKLGMTDSGIKGLVNGVYTAIEDFRVEKIGLRTYRGYLPEQTYVRALLAESERHLNYPSSEPVMKAYQSFFKSLTYGIQPMQDLSFFEEIVEEARVVDTVEDLLNSTIDITRKLVERYGPPPSYSEFEVENTVVPSDVLDHDVKETAAKLGKRHVNPTKSIIEEYSTIIDEHNRLLDEERKKRLEQGNLEELDASPGVERGLILEQISGIGDAYRVTRNTQPQINRLISKLRKWQSGWDEVLDYSGAELDVDAYLLERRSTTGRWFIDEKQISPRTSIAVLFDMSSSISDLEEQYLRSIVIIGEALNFFRMNFSLFVFNQGFFHVVKMCREPWGRSIEEKLAALETKGGTPLAEALMLTQHYAAMEGCWNIVVITDGEPNDVKKAAEAVKIVEASGISVSLIGFRTATKKMYTQFFNMLGNRQGRVQVINTVNTLPDAFFDAIKMSSD